MTGVSTATQTLGVVKLAYVGTFLAAAVLSIASLSRLGEVQDADTRLGLAWLLAGSGLWAASTAGFILSPGLALSVAFHTVGLIVGLSTVGAWLYFTSAYTGRTLHRNRTLRWIAIGVFVLIVAVKATNPLHGIYYGIELVQTPFPHYAIQNGVLHWTVMGASYALSAIGYFMLYERFRAVSFDTTPLLVLVGLTGLPIVLDIAGFTSPALIDVSYEPIGVAVFATGLLFVFLDQFQTVRVAGERDDPVLALDTEDRVHQFNRAAGQVFPDRLRDAEGEPVDSVFPDLGDPDTERQIVEVRGEDGPRFYRVTTTPFTGGQTRLGRLLVFTDVTEEERARREQARQNERLDRFTSTVSHDLRNPLTVARGRLEIAAEETDSEHVETALAALERMETMIEDLLELARNGQPIDETETVSLAEAAESAWEMVRTPDADLSVAGDRSIEADPDRLASLFENLFRNAVEHVGSDVSVTVAPIEGGFAVADDGPGIPPEERSKVLESGYSTEESGTGFGLAIVTEVAEAHDWTVRITESETGGARFEFRGVD